MKHVFVALAAVGLLVSGCGPAEGSEETGTENGAVEQQATRCISACWGNCSKISTTPMEYSECRLGCDEACAGEY